MKGSPVVTVQNTDSVTPVSLDLNPDDSQGGADTHIE